MLALEVPLAFPVTADASNPAELASAQRQRSLAHAARHDILRRLAPSLRHDMVVPLQSLGMTMEALSARLDRGAVDSADLHAAVSKLNRLTRKAVASCLHVATWMEPAEDDSVPLNEGVEECAGLLASSLNFRGFHLRNEVRDIPMEVSRGALRFLLAASLLSLAEHAPGGGELVLSGETAAGHAVVAVTWQPSADAASTQLHDAGQATLSWTEVQALAALEAVELRRSPSEIILRFPRSVVTTPLKMVPV
ncbi:hypothetical protein FN976_09505 [Caenimonas sedimenti]|uniref:Uncharacterized protein n=1 Tax=Caenimonas sedimenti TaxID=2596921 RepID=A0A562ZSM9_9BURK|nr:hypothetical protein [Caenimonas sedimenti]TWO71600.1 hypothetical protein FN976_09505 [Caenimonas sedimenti]